MRSDAHPSRAKHARRLATAAALVICALPAASVGAAHADDSRGSETSSRAALAPVFNPVVWESMDFVYAHTTLEYGAQNPADVAVIARVSNASGQLAEHRLDWVRTEGARAYYSWRFDRMPPGSYQVQFSATLGGTPVSVTRTVNLIAADDAPPLVAKTSVPAAPNAVGWFLRTPVITLTASDGGTGVLSLRHRVDGGAWTTAPANVAQIDLAPHGDGVHTIEYEATDRHGNTTGVLDTVVRIDTAKPTVRFGDPREGARYGVGEQVIADYTCEDAAPGSGLADCDGPIATGAPLDTSTPGEHSFEVLATDRAGNFTRQRVNYTVRDDTEAPRIVFQRPPLPASGWYRTPGVHVSATATDDSPIESFEVRVDGRIQDTPGHAFDRTISGDGRHVVEARAQDLVGNDSGWRRIDLPIDATAPRVSLDIDGGGARNGSAASNTTDGSAEASADGSTDALVEYRQGAKVTARFDCEDALSGIASCTASAGRTLLTDGARLPTGRAGLHRVTVEATDAAGNRSTRSVDYRVVAAVTPERPALPPTGAESPAPVTAAALIAAGAMLLVAGSVARARRRR